MCACVSPSGDARLLSSPQTAKLDWPALLQLADDHGVQVMLAKRLEQTGYANVPAPVKETLQNSARIQNLVNLALTADLFRILEEFSKAGLEAIPVKGPVLSLVAYGHPAARSFGDLDLLILHRDVPLAIESLLAMGYEPDLPLAVLRSGKIPGEYLFRQTETRRLVELHTEKTFRHYPSPMRLEEMMARKRSLTLDGRDVPVLSLEDEIVFDCVHGGKDFWERLVWVADVAAIVMRYQDIDWEKVLPAADEVGARRMLLTGLRLAETVLALRLPDAIADLTRRDLQSERLCARILNWLPHAGYRSPNLLTRAFYRSKIAGGGISGLGYLARLSLVPTQDDWRANGGRSNSWLRDVFLRPFRLIRKYGSNN